MIVPYFPRGLSDSELAFFQNQIDTLLESKADKSYVENVVNNVLNTYIEQNNQVISEMKETHTNDISNIEDTINTNNRDFNAAINNINTAISDLTDVVNNHITDSTTQFTNISNQITELNNQLTELEGASSIIISSTAPADTKALWVDSSGIGNVYNGSAWVKLGAVWK